MKKRKLLGFLWCLWWVVPCEAAEEEKKVFLYNWAGYIPEEVIREFEKETGIQVIYDVFDSIELLETKLIMKLGYDLVFPPAWPVYGRGISLGLFLPLRKEWLPNAKNFDATVLSKIEILDPILQLESFLTKRNHAFEWQNYGFFPMYNCKSHTRYWSV